MKALLVAIVFLSSNALAYFDEIQGWSIQTGRWDESAQALAGDFNGDGRTDIALVSATGYCGSNVYIYASTGSSFVYSTWGVNLPSDCSGAGRRWVAGDFNGDGRTDLATIINDRGLNTVRVFPSTGYNFNTNFWTYAYRAGAWDASHQWRAGDFDADGKSDLAVIWRDAGDTTSVTVFTTSRYGVISSVWASRMGGWGGNNKWVVGDVDGNGMSDLIAAWNDNGLVSIAARISTGFTFVYSDLVFRAGGWGDNNVYLASDFNGDGFSDMAIGWNDSGLNSIGGYLSNGQYMNFVGLASRLGGWGDRNKWVVGDFNGDGKTDIAIIWKDGSMNTVAVNPSK